MSDRLYTVNPSYLSSNYNLLTPNLGFMQDQSWTNKFPTLFDKQGLNTQFQVKQPQQPVEQPGFFQKGFSSSPKGQQLTKSAGWVNAGASALNALNSAYGASNNTGNALSTIGGVVGSIPTPYTAVAGAVLGLAGGIANSLTDTVNEQHKNAISKQIGNIASTTSQATEYSGLQADYQKLAGTHLDLGDINQWGSAGILSSGRKRQKARQQAVDALEVAQQTALGNLGERGRAINQSNMLNMYSNLMAFGGAIDYAFTNDYLHNGYLKATKDNKLDSIINGDNYLSNGQSFFADGGEMPNATGYEEGNTYNVNENEYRKLLEQGYQVEVINK